MIYHYFGNKQVLYSAVLTETLADGLRKLHVVRDREPLEVVRGALEAYFDYCMAHPNYVTLILREAADDWAAFIDLVPAGVVPYQQDLVAALEQGQAQGVFRPAADPVLLLLISASAILLLAPLAQRAGEAWPKAKQPELLRDELIDQILHGLLQPGR